MPNTPLSDTSLSDTAKLASQPDTNMSASHNRVADNDTVATATDGSTVH